jgi:hypothetical protein
MVKWECPCFCEPPGNPKVDMWSVSEKVVRKGGFESSGSAEKKSLNKKTGDFLRVHIHNEI